MKNPSFHSAVRRPRAESAFTMVEIALALAVIGFALVAIVGVLPRGLEAQKENREDTIIDQEANYFLDAIRNGARGLDDLTNYVYEIRRTTQEYDANTNKVGTAVATVFTYNTPSIDPALTPRVVVGFPIDRGSRIIGLLGWPKYEPSTRVPGNFFSNNVVAYVRSLSGAATEKVPQRDANVRELAFGYRLTSEIMPVPMPLPLNTNSVYAQNLQGNLHEVRLLFRWPVIPRGNVGPTGREIYRTQVGGRYLRVADTNQTQAPQDLFFFEPSIYRKQS